jgi:hypothetical protein
MAKQVTNVERQTVQPHKHALEREQVTLTCDDGSEYVFERPADSPRKKYNLARRVKPDGELSTSKGILPSSVKDSMDRLTERLANLGIERGWEK